MKQSTAAAAAAPDKQAATTPSSATTTPSPLALEPRHIIPLVSTLALAGWVLYRRIADVSSGHVDDLVGGSPLWRLPSAVSLEALGVATAVTVSLAVWVYCIMMPSARRHQKRTAAPSSSSSTTASTTLEEAAAAATPLFADASDPNSRYWYIHGRRYNLERFLDEHPAGRLPLEMTRGRECTELFESYHALSSGKPWLLLRKYEVSAADATALGLGPVPYADITARFDWNATPFYDTLKTRVNAYFDGEGGKRTRTMAAHKTPWHMRAFIVSMLAATAFAYWHFARGAWWSLAVLPWTYWLSGSQLMHTAGHWALTTVPWVNHAASYLGSLHISPTTWHRQHTIGHHVHTNIHGLDPDLEHFNRVWRSSPEQPWFPRYVAHRTKMLYYVWFATLGPSMLSEIGYMAQGKMAGTVPYLFARRRDYYTHVAGRLAVTFVLWGLPFLLFSSALKAAAFAFVPVLLHGGIFFAFSQVSHVNADCFPASTAADAAAVQEFAVHEVATCHDYAVGSRLWCTLSNGLNCQVIHHLFPAVDPWHYPYLVPIVQQTCAEFGVRYSVSPSFWVAMRRLFEHIATINDAPQPAAACAPAAKAGKAE